MALLLPGLLLELTVLGSGLGGFVGRLLLGYTVGRYAATLLPIAAGYAIAHYVTLLIQGRASLPGMLLDPTALEVDIGWLPAGFVWYLSVGAIVVGHVAAVMLGYTVLSLWIIAQPITIEVA